MACDHCTDPDGAPCVPWYGLAPHRHHLPDLGTTVFLPREEWPNNFREDAESPNQGIWWCAYCGEGEPEPRTWKPNRIQLKRTKGWRMPPNTVKVDRSTRWGNPFVVTEDRPADAVALAYRTWLTVEGCHAGMPERKAKLLDAMRDLRGKNLACWCPLDQLCHADVLLEIANQ